MDSTTKAPSSFTVIDGPNPHFVRAKQIVKAHPEVAKYFGPHPATGAWVGVVVAIQMVAAFLLRDASWPIVFLAAYLIGAPASHALFVLIHEAAHNLIARTSYANRIWGMLANVGQGIPSATSFRYFHMLHHSHLDEYHFDADLAFEKEAEFVGTSPLRKALWFLVFPLIEIIRPLNVNKAFFDRWIVINMVVILATNSLIYLICGPAGLGYVLASTLFGVGFHPLGARWIQEHYTFVEGQETYSYYGWANRFAFNIGFHNEHHDLVRVPWVHLPKIKAAAPEFYDHLHAHTSYLQIFIGFIFDQKMSLFSRITRQRA